jgi:hypothetical protein
MAASSTPEEFVRAVVAPADAAVLPVVAEELLRISRGEREDFLQQAEKARMLIFALCTAGYASAFAKLVETLEDEVSNDRLREAWLDADDMDRTPNPRESWHYANTIIHVLRLLGSPLAVKIAEDFQSKARSSSFAAALRTSAILAEHGPLRPDDGSIPESLLQELNRGEKA